MNPFFILGLGLMLLGVLAEASKKAAAPSQPALPAPPATVTPPAPAPAATVTPPAPPAN